MLINHRITITDYRDDCTYERDYIASPDWSADVYHLASMVIDADPNFASLRNHYGDGKASGPLFNRDGIEVGRYDTTEIA